MSDDRSATKGPNLPVAGRLSPVWLWLLLALCVVVRSPGIGRPLVGNFATKNVVYAMIARNWAEGRSSLAYPMLDCLADGGRSLHMLEFPVSVCLTAWLWKTLGGSLDVWGRGTAVAFSAASVGLLFALVRRRHGQTAALATGVALALSPVSIIYGQSFMLDASLVFFTVATFYALDRWLEGGRATWLMAGSVFLALLVLSKIYMGLFLLPLAAAVFAGKGRSDSGRLQRQTERRYGPPVLAAFLAIVPATCWYGHAMATAAPGGPLADRVFDSLQKSLSVHSDTHFLLAAPDFYRQVLDDFCTVVLTPVGFVIALAGALHRDWRKYGPWLLASGLLVAALPRKFYEMNYYWVAVLPPVCVMIGLGWQVIHERLRPKWAPTAGLFVVALALSLRYAARPAFVTPEEDRAVVAAAEAIQQLTAEDEPVVTMHGSTIDLLYYCDRPGWAVAPDTPQLADLMEGYRRQGARFFVVAGPEATAEGLGEWAGQKAIQTAEGFRIYRLSPPTRSR